MPEVNVQQVLAEPPHQPAQRPRLPLRLAMKPIATLENTATGYL